MFALSFVPCDEVIHLRKGTGKSPGGEGSGGGNQFGIPCGTGKAPGGDGGGGGGGNPPGKLCDAANGAVQRKISQTLNVNN